jgi:hypothetical protein
VATLDAEIDRLQALEEGAHRVPPERQKRALANLRRRRTRFARRLQKLEQRLAECELAIIDEFSNVDLKLCASFMPLCPNLRALVFVFDEWQIRPIKRGQPCLDMLRAMGDTFGVRLVRNQRVSGTAAARLLAVDDCILARRARDAVFEELVAGAALPPGAAREGCFLVTPSGRGAAHDMAWIYTELLAGWQNVQILTLTNAERRLANATVHRALWHGEDAGAFFAGQRLTVHRNFEAARLRLGAGSALAAPDRSIAHPADGDSDSDSDDGHAGGAPPRRRRTAARPPLPLSDAISNGVVIVFEAWREYDLRRRSWLPARATVAATVPAGRARFLMARDGRQFCVHAGYTPADAFVPAWAQTVDTAQGREFDADLVRLPADPGPFGLRHLHVAHSRGKRCVAYYGTRAQWEALARNPETPRQTLLAWRLRALVARWTQRRAGIPAGFLGAV